MAIIGGFDVHRAQITFDYLDTDTGEVTRGEIRPASRSVLRTWLGRFAGRADVSFAVEGCTGWRFVVEELAAAGISPHLAEPADTATQRGRKKRAKTDRTDARLLRELLDRHRRARHGHRPHAPRARSRAPLRPRQPVHQLRLRKTLPGGRHRSFDGHRRRLFR